jgi:germination protein M
MVRRFIACMAVAATVTACSSSSPVASSTTGSPTTASSPSTSPVTSTTAGPTSTASSTTTGTTAPTTTAAVASVDVVAYLARAEKVTPVRRSVTVAKDKAADPGTLIAAALTAVAAGPTAAEAALGFASAVPAATVVHSAHLDGTSAVVDLSSGFTSGGGSLSMMLRWVQFVYTVTEVTGVESVTLLIDGKSVDMIGGEGLEVKAQTKRADLELWAQTAAIIVTTPLPFDRVTVPIHVAGTSDAYEATFRIRITDSKGTQLADQMVMATCGSGCRGTFAVDVPIGTGGVGPLTLRAYENSAKDGSEINVVEFPITVATS